MTKSEILTALRESGGYVSGQELCEKLQVSRTAVWKKMKQLQEEGYEIEAVPNRGYRIVACPDIIAAEEVESRLCTRRMGHPVVYYEEVTSTNQVLKKLAEEGAPEGTLVTADAQNQGKGRAGRVWMIQPGANIAMSLLLRPQISPARISMVTLVMGLAVTCACRELYGVDTGIKWPNDVVINGKKICGILTEMSMELMAVNYVVIGTGINVNETEFPEEIRDKATSLQLELGRKLGRAELMACCMKYFEEFYDQFLSTGDLSLLQEQYNGLLLNRNRGVRVLEPGREYSGVALGINKDGQLLVEKEDGSQTAVYAGEVSVRGVYGYV